MLRVFNTMSGEIELFKPRDDAKVKMATCGPSVYRRPHIGNYRTFLFEDVLQRYLEYLGFDIVRLITLTDVEDKAIVEAEEKEISVEELTQNNTEIFFKEAGLLKMMPSTFASRSSTSVDQAAKLIKTLIEKGYAYRKEHKGAQNIYYDPTRFKGFGKLSKIDVNEWPRKKRRFHKDTYPGTRWNKGDFILWYGYKEGNKTCWDTEIGTGRPGWNVQDAAMITKHLGFYVDIVCGGIDNLVRHHDYTIAVAEGASNKDLSRYWLHGEHLLVDGKKMSKSQGNFIYLDDLTRQGYSTEHIRFFLIYSHYRKKFNVTFKKLKETSQKLDTLRDMVGKLKRIKVEKAESNEETGRYVNGIVIAFERHMNKDLNVKNAFDEVFDIVFKLNTLRKNGKLSLKDADAAIANLQKIDHVLQTIF